MILHGILEQVDAQTNENSNPNLSNQQDDVGKYLHEKLMSLSMGKKQQKVFKNLFFCLKKSLIIGSGKSCSKISIFKSNWFRSNNDLLW